MQVPLFGRVSRGRVLLLVVTMALALVASQEQPSKAAPSQGEAEKFSSQARLYENGDRQGSATFVDRNWALAPVHLIQHPETLSGYFLRFGITQVGQGVTQTRRIDRIEVHPTADLALLHFSEPLGPDIWIPDLATARPTPGATADIYGWEDGRRLNHMASTILSVSSPKNTEYMRHHDKEGFFDASFPEGIDPIVVFAKVDEAGSRRIFPTLFTKPGDSGGGLFNETGKLIGINWGGAPYHYLNSWGELDLSQIVTTGYEQPVYEYAAWIKRIIRGEGSSGSKQTHDELRRRRLLDSSPDNHIYLSFHGHPSFSFTFRPHYVSESKDGQGVRTGTCIGGCKKDFSWDPDEVDYAYIHIHASSGEFLGNYYTQRFDGHDNCILVKAGGTITETGDETQGCHRG